MLKKSCVLILSAALPCAAQFNPDGKSVKTVSPVRQVLEMKDDSYVTMQGHIIKQTGKEKYLFQDSTGSITVEIDDEDWNGTSVSPSDTVEITGEVDRNFFSSEVDADIIKKL